MLRAMAPVDSPPTVGLAWLVRLRWGSALAQLVMLAIVIVAFDTRVTVGAAGGLLVTTLATNAALLAWSRRAPSRPWIIGAVLLLDAALLTALLAVTGGPANPFTAFYIVHVALAALLLDTRGALLLALATSVGFGSLFFFVSPREAMEVMHRGGGFSLHLQGMWVAYLLAAAFVGYFVAKVARALERREREVAELSRYAARTEKLAALSTLAAGTAHELGTPLGTIAIVARELERAAEEELDRAAVRDDARLLREQAERCRSILARMGTQAGELAGEAPRRVSLGDVVDGVRDAIGAPRAARIAVAGDVADKTLRVPERALVSALVNVVQNALDASDDGAPVELALRDEPRFVVLAVNDRGPGMSPETLRRIGEPFFTTKEPGKGMGLGLFLVGSFLDRLGGKLTVQSEPGAGARVELWVPRELPS